MMSKSEEAVQPVRPPVASQQIPTQQVYSQPANAALLSDYPVTLVCPKCQQQVLTNVQYVNGMLTWILVLVLILVFFPLAFIPCCIDSCKDAEHYCPNCNSLIGVKKKLS